MKISWKILSKTATILTILTGGWFILDKCTHSSHNLEAQISIDRYHLPISKKNQCKFASPYDIIPLNSHKYIIANTITDSLFNNFDFKRYSRPTITDCIKAAIPNNFEIIKDSISQMIRSYNDFFLNTIYFASSQIKNNGDKSIKNLAFYINTYGLYEVYIEDQLIQKGEFYNDIQIGNLNPSNTANIKIWAKNHLSEYSKYKYTFSEGHIIPTFLKPIKKGIWSWIYFNPSSTIWIIITFLLCLPLLYYSWIYPFIKKD